MNRGKGKGEKRLNSKGGILDMSQTFDALKEKLSNADLGQAKEVMEQAKQAYDDGKIDENEKKELLESAKSVIGGKGIGGLF